eukprot:TRINITY_DN5837_c0_g1_i1.p1 TRINITY_DN5837_c0_g1~~TRINITY_DN5837_c0_g1_i1.p1  ORF type:complete len:549 (-),score=109.92 TRINITY_DN5837_c0_g1_i1:534-2180(-)
MALRTIGAICRRSNGAGFKLATPRKDRSFAPANLRPQHWAAAASGANIYVQRRFTVKPSQRVFDIARVDDVSAEVDRLFAAGEIEKAATSLREALDDFCPDITDSYSIVRCFEQFSKLGELYTIQYKWSEAKPVFQKLVNAIENVIVSQREKKRNIVAACTREGRPVESDETYEETVSQLKLLDTALASVLHDLGGSHERLREYEDAQKAYKRSLEISTLGGDDMAASNVAAALGSLYDKAGNSAEAEAMHIQAMKLNPFCERWDHPNFATALHPFHRRPRVVTVDQVLDNMKEPTNPSGDSDFVNVDETPSQGLAREDIQSALDVLPETDENRRREVEIALEEATKLNTQLAGLELDAAKSVLREAEARLPANQLYQVASAYVYAATLHKRLGQLSEAWETLEKAQEAYRNSGIPALAPNSLAYSNLIAHKGHLCNYVSDVDKALDFYKQALEIKVAAPGSESDSLHTALLKFDMAVAYIEKKQIADGVRLLVDAVTTLREKLGDDHIYVSSLRNTLQTIIDATTPQASEATKSAMQRVQHLQNIAR